MKRRRLDVAIEVEASQTRCCSCPFQHSETDSCAIFGRIESVAPVAGIDRPWEYGHKRHKECAIAEWRAKRKSKTGEVTP